MKIDRLKKEAAKTSSKRNKKEPWLTDLSPEQLESVTGGTEGCTCSCYSYGACNAELT